MRRIDEALLANTNLGNIRAVEGWVRSFWHSLRDFVGTGFGFCVVRDGTILSWCLSVFVSDENFEFGIATAPDHRRKGLATLAAAACVEHCVENHRIPHWHCWEDNVPSIKVAEKVGFENPTLYTVYRFDL
jgi:RimJ/RimL family protein N-acetyltransferase